MLYLFYHLSQMSVAPSYQLSYGALPFIAPGKLSGLTFKTQFHNAFAYVILLILFPFTFASSPSLALLHTNNSSITVHSRTTCSSQVITNLSPSLRRILSATSTSLSSMRLSFSVPHSLLISFLSISYL